MYLLFSYKPFAHYSSNSYKIQAAKTVLSGAFDRFVTPLLISRFATFVASGQHILDEEVKFYENDPSPWLTSDSDGNDSDPSHDRY